MKGPFDWIKTIIIAGVVAIALSACAVTPYPGQGIAGELGSISQTQEENVAVDQGALDALADKIVKANTPVERALRFCALGMLTTEGWVVESQFFSPGYEHRLNTWAAAQQFQSAIEQVRQLADANSPFFDTEMTYVLLALERSMVVLARDTIGKHIVMFVTGDVGGFITTAREIAARGIIKAAMLRDINRFYDQLVAGTVDLDEAWLTCMSRIERNVQMIGGFNTLQTGAATTNASPNLGQ